MRIYRPSLRYLFRIIVCGLLMTGCESDNDDKPMTEEQAEAEIEDVSLLGTWKGIAGTGQVNVTLKLRDEWPYGVHGSLTWPGNDTRSVQGVYPHGKDNKALLWISNSGDSRDVDSWDLTIQGNTMTGVGEKHEGGSYAVSLTKS